MTMEAGAPATDHISAGAIDHGLVIYELHIGDFSPEGTFKGVTDRLDYIRDLGVSAIELMPVQEFPGDRSWDYNPAFFFCPESSYGRCAIFRIIGCSNFTSMAFAMTTVRASAGMPRTA